MAISEQVRSLISIGVSVGVNCQPCLQYHIAKAKEVGIEENDILEAIATGKAVRKGAAYKMDQYIQGLVEEPSDASPERRQRDSSSCCKG
nr:carboxymuconolactone decarboxylase family protein [uncultured Anaeromusa sp.]